MPNRVPFNDAYTPEPNSGCWLWLLSTNNSKRGDYGRAWVDGEYEGAHRWAYRLFIGSIPEGLYVLHRCDTPSCVNPRHLFLGTALDNNRDRARKGRNAVPAAHLHPETVRGERNGRALIKEDVARGILQARGSRASVASRFGVSLHIVKSIRGRRTWRHLTETEPPA